MEMKIIRYQTKNEPIKNGWLYNDMVGEVEGDVFSEFRRLDAELPLASVRLLAPCKPSKIVCVGRNYLEHARELGNEVPKVPLIFLKPPSSIIGPEDTILLPPQSSQVEHEAELVAVIGKRCKGVAPDKAKKYILGYTVGNDVTARDLQKSDDQWTRAKGFDTFCSFGPWIDTEFDPADALITCKVSGQPSQMGSTRDMAFNVSTLVAYVSSVMTLEPGDLIFTGTPSGVGPLSDGDTVSVTIDGLGTLENKVKAA